MSAAVTAATGKLFLDESLARTKASPRDVLVLTPRRQIGYRIRNNLNATGVTAHSYFFEEALEAARARERFTLLNLLVNPDDRVALRCWLGFGHHERAVKHYAQISERCLQQGIAPLEAVEQLRRGEFAFRGSKLLVDRLDALDRERAAMASLTGQALMDALFPDGDPDIADVRELARLALSIAAEEVNARALLDDLRLRILYPEPPPLGDYVRVMSLYKSKGLSARLVVVAGCVEGWVPFVNDELDYHAAQREMEEQRRLFYVAITRTKEALVLSSFVTMPAALAYRLHVRSSGRSGDRVLVQASRFLRELGPQAPAPRAG